MFFALSTHRHMVRPASVPVLHHTWYHRKLQQYKLYKMTANHETEIYIDTGRIPLLFLHNQVRGHRTGSSHSDRKEIWPCISERTGLDSNQVLSLSTRWQSARHNTRAESTGFKQIPGLALCQREDMSYSKQASRESRAPFLGSNL